MHIFDIIVLSVFAIFAFIGAYRGFITEAFRLAALIGGFIGAVIWYDSLYRRLDFLGVPAAAKTAISFVFCYLAIALGLMLIGWIIKKAAHLAMLGWADRLFGGVAGAAKATVVIWVFVLSVSLLPGSGLRRVFTGSRTYDLFNALPVKISVPGIHKPGGFSGVEAPEPIQKARKKLSTLRAKVDSLKQLADTE
jgi:uncharacterized membrane protein required for colicin V production